MDNADRYRRDNPDRHPIEEPNLLQKAASLAGAVVAEAGHVLSGKGEITVAICAERKAICDACPLQDKAADRCNLCGCNLSMKRSMASQSCPDGKWGAII